MIKYILLYVLANADKKGMNMAIEAGNGNFSCFIHEIKVEDC